jgi:hypothetical protein
VEPGTWNGRKTMNELRTEVDALLDRINHILVRL